MSRLAVLLLMSLGTVACEASVDLATRGDQQTGKDENATEADAKEQAKKEALAKLSVRDLRIANAELDAAGKTTITLAWSNVKGATGYRIERAEATEDGKPGTFAKVATTSDTKKTTFKEEEPLEGDSFYRVVTLSPELESPSEPTIALPVAESGYAIAAQTLQGSGDLATPFKVPLEGVVRHPKSLNGTFPLVVMLFGNHGVCRSAEDGDYCPPMPTSGTVTNSCPDGKGTTVPNVQGYNYLLETLAAQGYVTVSIDANALNCREDFIQQRTMLLFEHLKRWKTFTATGGPAPLGKSLVGKVDLERVGLMGHSRGAEAVALAPEMLARAPIAGVKIASVFSIAPTDGHGSKPMDTDFTVLGPLCDGDVWQVAGINMYDRIRNDSKRVKPARQILFGGANHNYFNDTWADEDDNESAGPTRTCSASVLAGGDEPAANKTAQRGMISVALTDVFGATLLGKPMPDYLRAEAPAPEAMNQWAGTKIDLRMSYSGGAHKLIDDFAKTPAETNVLGEKNRFTGFEESLACGGTDCDLALSVCTEETCNGFLGPCTGDDNSGCKNIYQLFHRFDSVKTLALSWKSSSALVAIDLGGLDAKRFGAIAFRMGAADSPLNAADVDQDGTLELTDSSNEVATVKLSAVQRIPRLYAARAANDTRSDVRPAKELLQSVRLTKAVIAAANAKLDWSSLKRLSITMDAEGHSKGAAFVTDVELSD